MDEPRSTGALGRSSNWAHGLTAPIAPFYGSTVATVTPSQTSFPRSRHQPSKERGVRPTRRSPIRSHESARVPAPTPSRPPADGRARPRERARSAGQGEWPVIDDWWVALWSAVLRPTSSPMGANDWLCKPSAAHPRPVILLHGTYSNMYASFANLAAPLRREGYCVYAFNYGDWPLGLGVFPAIKGLRPRRSVSPAGEGVRRSRAPADGRRAGRPRRLLAGWRGGARVPPWQGGANAADPSQNVVNTVVGLASANEGSTAGALTSILRANGHHQARPRRARPELKAAPARSDFFRQLNLPRETDRACGT